MAGATAGGPTPPFDGTSMDAQVGNILLRGDPSTADYAYAYQIASQPKITMQQTPNGLVPVYQTPDLSSIRQPTYGKSAAPASAPIAPGPRIGTDSGLSPAIGTQPSSTGISVGSAIPGTKAPATEAQQRAGVLTGQLEYDVPIILQNYDSLSDLKSKTLGKLPGVGPAFQSDSYKSASQALDASVQTIVFELSGANTGAEEKRSTAKSLTPNVFDGPKQIQEKKARLVAYVKSVADASGDPEKKAKAQAILTSLNQSTPFTKPVVIDGVTIEPM